eukprot:IDg18489t1
MSSRLCFAALRALPPVRSLPARKMRCETHMAPAGAPLMRRVRTMTAAGSKSRKNAGEANAVSDAMKAGVDRGAAERSIAAVQRASFGNEAIVSEFLPWEDAESVAR